MIHYCEICFSEFTSTDLDSLFCPLHEKLMSRKSSKASLKKFQYDIPAKRKTRTRYKPLDKIEVS